MPRGDRGHLGRGLGRGREVAGHGCGHTPLDQAIGHGSLLIKPIQNYCGRLCLRRELARILTCQRHAPVLASLPSRHNLSSLRFDSVLPKAYFLPTSYLVLAEVREETDLLSRFFPVSVKDKPALPAVRIGRAVVDQKVVGAAVGAFGGIKNQRNFGTEVLLDPPPLAQTAVGRVVGAPKE